MYVDLFTQTLVDRELKRLFHESELRPYIHPPGQPRETLVRLSLPSMVVVRRYVNGREVATMWSPREFADGDMGGRSLEEKAAEIRDDA